MSDLPTTSDGASMSSQQQLLEQLRDLPLAALQDLDVFVSVLVARAAAGFYAEAEPPPRVTDLSTQEPFLRTLRLLGSRDAQLIDQYVLVLAGRALKWSYDDPVSLELAMELMGRDPFLQRELKAINREFASAEANGLESA